MSCYAASDSLGLPLAALSGLGGVTLEEDLQLAGVTVGGDDEVSRLMKAGIRAVTGITNNKRHPRCNTHVRLVRGVTVLQQHGESLQAPGVHPKVPGHQVLMEGAKGAVVLGDGRDRSEPLQVDQPSSAQQDADPLLQPLRLLLQSEVAGQLL